ncbi:hypothetical protein SV7mr_52450 [Stieleria bergensis]|uniref:DUF1772 domain-containing protein n=1 Tax=Stieleria bergensis TaxID=2528025 RepID=A0A517T2T5_9BACT|nr:MAG: hypothetical protein CBB71_23615 [Rhodopirellula sp. TMED11]QDT62695.1 hypothetical protein SV7mr_52450 [Planctomycetes bacterium SV_7m_r]
MNANLVFLTNLLSTWYLMGLIWMVQVVHYELFDRVGADQFARYETDHTRLITPIVALPMLIELISAMGLIAMSPAGFPRWAAWAGLALIGVVWLTTFFVSVPCHSTLVNGFDQDAYRKLVNTNWIRTIAWSLRGILLGYFTVRLING